MAAGTWRVTFTFSFELAESGMDALALLVQTIRVDPAGFTVVGLCISADNPVAAVFEAYDEVCALFRYVGQPEVWHEVVVSVQADRQDPGVTAAGAC